MEMEKRTDDIFLHSFLVKTMMRSGLSSDRLQKKLDYDIFVALRNTEIVFLRSTKLLMTRCQLMISVSQRQQNSVPQIVP